MPNLSPVVSWQKHAPWEMASARSTMMVAGGLAVVEHNKERLVSVIGVEPVGITGVVRVKSMSTYCGSMQAVTTASESKKRWKASGM